MVAALRQQWQRGPTPGELGLTLGLSVALHAGLIAAALLLPGLLHGPYIDIRLPGGIAVDLVGPIGGGAPRESVAPPPPGGAVPKLTAKAPVAARPVPAPRVTEELALPGTRRAPAAKAAPGPSLALPTVPAAPRGGPAPPATAGPPAATAGVPAGAPVPGGGDPGVGVGGGKGEVDPILGYYFALVQNKILSNWIQPAARRGQQEEVIVAVRVLRKGEIQGLAVETGSGNAELDRSALRAVQQAAPLPPLPPLFKEDSISLQIRFVLPGAKA